MVDTPWEDRFDPSLLRSVRERCGKSQEQVADAIGQERTNYIKYEASGHVPFPATLKKIADFLGVKVDAFLEEGPVTMSLLRVRQGLSRSEVAKQLGISGTWYRNIEDGKGSITEDQLSRLAEILGCDTHLLAKLLKVRSSN